MGMPSRVLFLNGFACLVSGCGSPSSSSAPETSAPPLETISKSAAPSPSVAAPEAPTAPPPKPAPPPAAKPKPTFQRIGVDAVSVALADDGTWLAAGTLGGVVVLEDLKQGQRLWERVLPAQARVLALSAATEKARVAALGGHAPLYPGYVLQSDTLDDLGPYGVEGQVGQALALSADGRSLALLARSEQGHVLSLSEVRDGAVTADAKAPKPIWSHAIEVSSGALVAISGAGAKVALAGSDGVWLWDRAGQQKVMALPSSWEEDARVIALRFDPLGQELWLASAEKLYLWKLEDESAEPDAEADTEPAFVDLALVQEDAPSVQIPEWSTLTETALLERIRGVVARESAAGFDPLVVARPSEGGVSFWDVQGRQAGYFDSDCRCQAYAFASAADLVACACESPSEVRVGKPVWTSKP